MSTWYYDNDVRQKFDEGRKYGDFPEKFPNFEPVNKYPIESNETQSSYKKKLT